VFFFVWLAGRCRYNTDDWRPEGGGGREVGIPRLVCRTLLGTNTIIQCYPLLRAFLYPPAEDARGCQRVPARCPRMVFGIIFIVLIITA